MRRVPVAVHRGQRRCAAPRSRSRHCCLVFPRLILRCAVPSFGRPFPAVFCVFPLARVFAGPAAGASERTAPRPACV